MSMGQVADAGTPPVTFYHGSSSAAFDGWRPDRGQSDEADMLFLSRSPNVARRYGRVFQVEYPVAGIPVITVDDWFNGKCPATSFLILGDRGYDFPVDTLVLRQDPGAIFEAVLNVDDLDDGLAITHDPSSPSDRQFSEYIDEHYQGDQQQWQAEAEWAA